MEQDAPETKVLLRRYLPVATIADMACGLNLWLDFCPMLMSAAVLRICSASMPMLFTCLGVSASAPPPMFKLHTCMPAGHANNALLNTDMRAGPAEDAVYPMLSPSMCILSVAPAHPAGA